MFIIMMDEISPHKIYHYISIYRFTKNNATGRLRSTSFYSSYKQITVCLQIDFTLRHGMLFAAVMVLILCALTCFIFFFGRILLRKSHHRRRRRRRHRHHHHHHHHHHTYYHGWLGKTCRSQQLLQLHVL